MATKEDLIALRNIFVKRRDNFIKGLKYAYGQIKPPEYSHCHPGAWRKYGEYRGMLYAIKKIDEVINNDE